MNKYINYSASVCVIVLLFLLGCNSNKPEQISSLYTNVPMETVCMSTPANGDIELRIWGMGNSQEDAIQNAYINAVNEVIFKGVNNGAGTNNHPLYPLIVDANTKRKNEEFFKSFFSKGGDYKFFVHENAESSRSRKIAKNKNRCNVSVIVVVNRQKLKDYLKDYGIYDNSNY